MGRKTDKVDRTAKREGEMMQRAFKNGHGMTKQKARGRQKMLNRDSLREFDQLFDEPVVLSREIILIGAKDAA